MDFPANVSRNATSIVVNHTAESLYSVFHDGVNKTRPVDLTTIKTPPNIDKSCLIQGFNMPGPHPWAIKSRVGVQSQPLKRCALPYLVRGVGIGCNQQEYSQISCGEFIINYSHPQIEAYPAICRVYIQ